MSINTLLSKTPLNNPVVPFPKLMISETPDRNGVHVIILAQSQERDSIKGTVIHGNVGWKMGEIFTSFVAGTFKDYEGSITLSN
jgi:hypothetical protein